MSSYLRLPIAYDVEGEVYPAATAAVATISDWGGSEDASVNGALVEIIDKHNAYFEARPIHPIDGWGKATLLCARRELVPANDFTAALLDEIEELY